jgi:hypothetical protein
MLNAQKENKRVICVIERVEKMTGCIRRSVYTGEMDIGPSIMQKREQGWEQQPKQEEHRELERSNISTSIVYGYGETYEVVAVGRECPR